MFMSLCFCLYTPAKCTATVKINSSFTGVMVWKKEKKQVEFT